MTDVAAVSMSLDIWIGFTCLWVDNVKKIGLLVKVAWNYAILTSEPSDICKKKGGAFI